MSSSKKNNGGNRSKGNSYRNGPNKSKGKGQRNQNQNRDSDGLRDIIAGFQRLGIPCNIQRGEIQVDHGCIGSLTPSDIVTIFAPEKRDIYNTARERYNQFPHNYLVVSLGKIASSAHESAIPISIGGKKETYYIPNAALKFDHLINGVVCDFQELSDKVKADEKNKFSTRDSIRPLTIKCLAIYVKGDQVMGIVGESILGIDYEEEPQGSVDPIMALTISSSVTYAPKGIFSGNASRYITLVDSIIGEQVNVVKQILHMTPDQVAKACAIISPITVDVGVISISKKGGKWFGLGCLIAYSYKNRNSSSTIAVVNPDTGDFVSADGNKVDLKAISKKFAKAKLVNMLQSFIRTNPDFGPASRMLEKIKPRKQDDDSESEETEDEAYSQDEGEDSPPEEGEEIVNPARARETRALEAQIAKMQKALKTPGSGISKLSRGTKPI